MLLAIQRVAPCILFMFLAGASAASQASTQGSERTPDAAGDASSPATPTTASGVVMLDYQTIPIKGYESIDLMGFHLFKKFNDWLYLGVGGHAPLFSGDYGGFMVFDASVHAQQRVFGKAFADVGASLGGGGGGKSVEQSKTISGTGGFRKAYVGLGYDFDILSAGVNYSNIQLAGSAIHHSQFDIYLEFPFTYRAGSYANAGGILPSRWNLTTDGHRPEGTEDVLQFGLDNIIQMKPEGVYKGKVNLLDVQFDHYLSDATYLLFEGGIGYRGLVLYNQVFGGLGYKYSYSPRVNVRAQMSVGSGGYDPDKINTGPGLLLYPKLSAE